MLSRIPLGASTSFIMMDYFLNIQSNTILGSSSDAKGNLLEQNYFGGSKPQENLGELHTNTSNILHSESTSAVCIDSFNLASLNVKINKARTVQTLQNRGIKTAVTVMLAQLPPHAPPLSRHTWEN